MRIRNLFTLSLFTATDVLACATCGLNKSFSPKMLLISTGFVLLPASFAGYIAWRIYKDSKHK